MACSAREAAGLTTSAEIPSASAPTVAAIVEAVFRPGKGLIIEKRTLAWRPWKVRVNQHLAKFTSVFNAPFGGRELMLNQNAPPKQRVEPVVPVAAMHKAVSGRRLFVVRGS